VPNSNTQANIDFVQFPLPPNPVVFQKSKNSITGPYSNILMPKQAGNIDYENELSVVIAKDAKNVSVEDASSYILGYTVGNDVSSRAWQAPDKSGGQFSYAKNFDGFCPIGPAIVSPDVIGDPQNLKMETRRDGKTVQSSNTSDMIFTVNEIISFLSQGTTIPAGSLILTGTPPGVAMFASKPPNFLHSGETVECEIEKIGSLRNKFA
jgi:2-keto-4-pentenoate hydratase/2-oxohepta-3-ene-1,7-dioic acid hydratase in catechol pathway